MNVYSTLALASAGGALLLAVGILALRRRILAEWALAAGLLLLALERGLSAMAAGPAVEQSLIWQQRSLWVLGLLPAPWLVFSLVYARGNAEAFLRKWRPMIAAAVVFPFALIGLFHRQLIAGTDQFENGNAAIVRLGWAGTVLYVFALSCAVFVLVNLERTFRAAVGTIRWRIKFVVLGVGVLFLVRVYTLSQGLLFRASNLPLETVTSIGTLMALGVIARGIFRAANVSTDVYPSLSILQGSLTITLAGTYLLLVGVLAKVVARMGGDASFALKAFLVLASLVGLTVLLQSDRVRLRLRRFVSRNFQRPLYDYRTIWRQFTDATAPHGEQTDLCGSVVRITADIFQSLAVSIWLVTERRDSFSLAASTSLTGQRALECAPTTSEALEVTRHFGDHPEPVDIERPNTPWAIALRRWHPSDFPTGGNRLCVPLIRHGQLLGVLILGDRVSGVTFPLQDFDLLKCIADQAAAGLLNIQMSQRLLHAKELEAFQTMATFFVHDLKNAASTLNLMLQNMPVHFNDPAFREDALRGMSKTVTHINGLIARLGEFRNRLEVRTTPADLNAVVRSTLNTFPGSPRLAVNTTLEPVPLAPLDSEQLQKVVLNLLLNAAEACNGEGQICVQTAQANGSVVLSVSDTGCGMSPAFVQGGLFRPFQTTKKTGLGIGMFQSKMIIDAHGGNIVVTSAPGKGARFDIHLPIRGTKL